MKVVLPPYNRSSFYVSEHGFNERFNGSLRDELLNREVFYSLREATQMIEAWRREYNHVRPHSSLSYQPPAPAACVSQAAARTLRYPEAATSPPPTLH